MLFNDPDEYIQMIVKRKIAWKNYYAHVSREHAEWIEKILEDEKYQIPEKVKERVRFNLKYVVK